MKLILQNYTGNARSPRLHDKDYPVTVTYSHDPRIRQPLREEVRRIACPFCRADAHCSCTRSNGQLRLQNHKKRVFAYKAAVAAGARP